MPASLYAFRDFLLIRQKTKQLTITAMTPEEIDHIASSPSISTRKDINDKTKYQRDLDSNRFDAMKTFWDQSKTQLVDNIVLVVMDADFKDCIFFDKNKQLKFQKNSSKFAQILDGQHRVAGAKLSQKYYDELVPVTILLQSEFKDDDLGLIFTKLNSEAQKIDDFIEMHLCSRYNLEPWNGVKAENSYKAMMGFYDDKTSVLYKNIQILKKEKSRRYSGKVIAETFLKMWNNKSWGEEMPHATTSNKTMIEQFGFMLDTFFGKKGTWAAEFTDEGSSLHSKDGFCKILIPLYPSFYKIAKNFASAGEPTLAEWDKAIKSIKDKKTKKHLSDVLKWENYRNFINFRMEKSVFNIINSLLEHTSAGGALVFDFSKTLGKAKTVNDYLENHIGPFSIRIQESGIVVSTPTKIDFEIFIERAELAFEKATLNIFDKTAGASDLIYVNGTYKTNKAHPANKGMIKTHIKKGGFKSGGTYEIQVEQETPSKQKRTETIVIKIP
jgi:hypothetical protein